MRLALPVGDCSQDPTMSLYPVHQSGRLVPYDPCHSYMPYIWGGSFSVADFAVLALAMSVCLTSEVGPFLWQTFPYGPCHVCTVCLTSEGGSFMWQTLPYWPLPCPSALHLRLALFCGRLCHMALAMSVYLASEGGPFCGSLCHMALAMSMCMTISEAGPFLWQTLPHPSACLCALHLRVALSVADVAIWPLPCLCAWRYLRLALFCGRRCHIPRHACVPYCIGYWACGVRLRESGALY